MGGRSIVTRSGSSPHTRGAHPKAIRRLHREDHPRIRGEHLQAAGSLLMSAGSSPHTRGALTAMVYLPYAAGIIPAYAGSTRPPRHRDGTAADHPRIRGEHFHIDSATWPITGSSPHTRGARFGSAGLVADAGIIPAYAGSTLRGDHLLRSSGDHPRIRGEHVKATCLGSSRTGSSPHTRGAQLYPHVGGCVERIIPAYAGSTSGGSRRRRAQWDHPRIRGEHRIVLQPGRFVKGSSPHTRGAQRRGR